MSVNHLIPTLQPTDLARFISTLEFSNRLGGYKRGFEGFADVGELENILSWGINFHSIPKIEPGMRIDEGARE